MRPLDPEPQVEKCRDGPAESGQGTRIDPELADEVQEIGEREAGRGRQATDDQAAESDGPTGVQIGAPILDAIVATSG